MSKLEVEFAFEIGDIVYLKTAAHCDGHRPRKCIVTEQIAQRCPGGVQLQYRLGGEQGTVLEICLTRDEPPYVPVTNGALQDHMRVANAQRYDTSKLWKKVDVVGTS